MRKLLTHAVMGSIALYGLGLTLFYLLHWTVGERLNIIAIANNLIHLALYPVALLLPLAVAFRRWWVGASLALPFGVLVVSYGPLFVNITPDVPPQSTQVSVLTYNLGSDIDDQILSIIHEANADIVALQEVARYAESTLRESLTAVYPHMAIHIGGGPADGQAILSRYPIIESEFIRSIMHGRERHQRAVLEIAGQQVVIYNAHPVHPGQVGLDVSRRGVDLDTVLLPARAEPGPTLLLGDFNMTPATRDYARVTRTFTDAYQVAGFGPGYTFPHGNHHRYGMIPTFLRIDYVFYSPHWAATEAHVLPESGSSDHLPLWVRLHLLPNERGG